MTAQPKTLAQRFAAQYARGVVPAALDALHTVKTNSRRIAILALAVSTPHQALYLFGLSHPAGVLDIATAAFFAVLIPATIDLGMITMLAVTQTVGIAQAAKRRAMWVLAVLVTVSATVNVVAHGPVVLRLLTGFTALVLAAVEWVSSSIAPDFAALETVETSAAPVSKVAVDRAAAARKGWATRRELEALRDGVTLANAPVSPATVTG